MKTVLLLIVLIPITGIVNAQHSDHENHKMESSSDVEAVKAVLKLYKDALEALDVSNTQHLFTEEAYIFENGSFEGTYKQYLDHHIGPELEHFKEFNFNDYKVHVTMEGEIAIAYETYTYKIVTGGENSRTIEKQGVATATLKKENGAWKIMQNHGSSRDLRK